MKRRLAEVNDIFKEEMEAEAEVHEQAEDAPQGEHGNDPGHDEENPEYVPQAELEEGEIQEEEDLEQEEELKEGELKEEDESSSSSSSEEDWNTFVPFQNETLVNFWMQVHVMRKSS